jgi:hypothetical protein
MAVTAGTTAPYAPPSAVLDIVSRHRNKGLPPVVDAAVLERSGLSHSLVPRTLQALTTLDLIDADGRLTSTFESIRLAPEADYQLRLMEWLNAAYADALAFVDPATASESEIRDAFRHYKPAGQQARMVTLFLGLYAAAGVSRGRPRGTTLRSQTSASHRMPTRAALAVQRASQQQVRVPPLASNLPAPIAGLLTKLPQEGRGWTRQQRDQLVTAFGATLDVCFPILTSGERDEEQSRLDTDP